MPNMGLSRLAYQAQTFRIYPNELLSEAQDALAHLADIDLRYEKALEHVGDGGRRAPPSALQDRLMQRHQRERHRFEEKLSVIHKRISDFMLDDLRSNQG
jgi:hypothetical protein